MKSGCTTLQPAARRSLPPLSEQSYRERVRYAAEKVRFSGTKIVMLTGPLGQRQDHLGPQAGRGAGAPGHPGQGGQPGQLLPGAQYYPRLPDGTLDYENPDTLDLPLIRQCLKELNETGKTVLPVYDFSRRHAPVRRKRST